MQHYNAHGHHVPEHLWDVARRVHELVLRDGVLDRWRGWIAEWLKQQAVEPGLDEHGYVRSPDRPAGEYLPLDFDLHIKEKYAVLGAVHDFAAGSGTVLIGPHDEPDKVTPAAVVYCVLRVTVAEYSRAEADLLLRFLADVQADLGDLAAEDKQRQPGKEDHRAEWIGKALVLRKANPNMPKAEIARRVGVHPGQLSPKRFPELAELEKMLQGQPISGYVTLNSETGLSDVEAIALAGDSPDRGKRIPGSRLYREYCSECSEPIRVQRDQVGKNPRCENCAE